ncbi:hypothetical protein ABZ464_02050 [Streptomyces sp. NPDC005820]|uniref:hypothetical protein n=1 Tax=Streptomyces sp. NPDC005820 TaxID=3157069 RepID=UPI0033CB3D2C
MSTVVLIHGTGVREPRFSALRARFTEELTGRRPDVTVLGYYWGGPHGATLSHGGASLPLESGGRHRALESDDHDPWEWLYAEPYLELGLASAGSPDGREERPPGAASPAREARRRLGAVTDETLPELAPHLSRAAAELAAEPLLTAAADSLPTDELAAILARALVADATRRALAEGGAVLPLADARDEAVAKLAQGFGASPEGSERGLKSWLLARVGALVARPVENRRRALTQAAHPAAGDILRYLSHGEPFRTGLRDLIAAAAPPVTLIGHSLGGIIALDTLALHDAPAVGLLITFGSQAPFLYESGALPGLTPPHPLPDHVPPWLNIYDPRDLLSYTGAALFPGRVTDRALPSSLPFPASHSAYWANPALYDCLAEHLP